MTLLQSKQVLQYDLTFQDIIHILQLVDQCPFQELEIELADGLKLRLKTRRRTVSPAPALVPASHKSPAVLKRQEGHPTTVAVGSAAGDASRPETADGIEVTSVSGGIFYRAPGPGEPSYTEVGQAVNAGDTLGLIEVMKLFTPVTAPVAGTVSAIRVANEEVVKASQVLVVIAPASD